MAPIRAHAPAGSNHASTREADRSACPFKLVPASELDSGWSRRRRGRRRSRFSEEQIINILKSAEGSGNIRDVFREHNITEQAFDIRMLKEIHEKKSACADTSSNSAEFLSQ